MDNLTAEVISKKARALKHCNKVLDTIEKKGSAVITLNCTGIAFTVQKNDAIYLQLQATKAQLVQDIGSYEILKKANQRSAIKRHAPAPIGASIALSDDEMHELNRAKRSNYNKTYWANLSPERKAEYAERAKAKRKAAKK